MLKSNLTTMVKIKKWSSKLQSHVDQLPDKNPEKKKTSGPSGIPAHDLQDATANTPPILRLKEPYLARDGQTNVENCQYST